MLDAPLIKSLLQGAGDVGDDAANTLASSGAAIPQSVIALFDGSNQLEITTADASGAFTATVGAPTSDTFASQGGDVGEANSPAVGSSDGELRQALELAGPTGLFTATITDPEVGSGTLAMPFDGGVNQQTQIFAAPAFVSALNSAPSLSMNDSADHGITATAPVVLTGSGASADGDMVGVSGNGTYSANLSSPSDGSTGGVDTTAAGGGPDTDSASQPSLSVNASNPTNVLFVVSGLPSDYSGTVTFTDSTGKADVVAVGGNGSYSANLSNLTDGTLTYVMTVSDPAGNVITVDPTTTLGLPPGVTLQPINGGPDYYANNGLTYAADAGWDNPDFIPIGPWQEALNSQSEANIWKALGWNTAFNIDTNNVSIPVLDANGISLI